MVWFDGDTVTPLVASAKDTCPKESRRFRVVRILRSLDPRKRRKAKLNRKPSADNAAAAPTHLFQRVSNQIWSFVLPESGQHSLHAVALGTPNQRVFLDDVELESRTGQVTFDGPNESVLKLRPEEVKSPQTEKAVRWTLLVNDRMVENAAPSGNGLRELRSLPDGEYIIATHFDAVNVVRNACRKFKFLLDGEQHEVIVAHQEFVWQVSLDGKLVDQESHTVNDNFGRAEFKVVASSGVEVPARLDMIWILKEMKWSYHLQVRGVSVPAYWYKGRGFVFDVVEPKIFSATDGALPENSPKDTGFAEKPEILDFSNEKKTLESLPQGVSYDSQTKTYQANIWVAKTKRYVFLGEFPSAELAHKKYIEAMDRFDSEKKLAPALKVNYAKESSLVLEEACPSFGGINLS